MTYLMIDFKKVEKFLHLYLKLESMSEQNADTSLRQIADPYIWSAEFLGIGKIKSFSLLSFDRLAG